MADLEFEAAARGVPPLLPDHAPSPRHAVAPSERTLPPKPVDPNVLPGFTVPEPRPRKIPVKGHTRRNPRRKETQMTTITTGGRAASMAAARARATDPETSHDAAASINVTPSQEDVLARFQERASTRKAAGPAGIPDWMTEGFTDEELVSLMERAGSKFSPSRIRTARRELADMGLLTATDQRRPTRRGRSADVYDLTERGRSWVLS